MESGNEVPLLFWPLVVLIMAYMGTILYLISYLRRVHNQFWVGMGSISLQNFIGRKSIQSLGDNMRLLGFLFGSRYKSLSDPKVVTLVWAIRVMVVACLMLMAIIFTSIPKS